MTRSFFREHILASFGIYYDDPEIIVDKNEMRIALGIILNDPEDKELVDSFLSKNEDFKRALLPERDALFSEFPFKNHASYILGPHKTYPALKKYLISEKG